MGAFNSKITTSKHGRRLGLQAISSAESGGNHGRLEFLAGPDGYRNEVTTAETTSTNLKPTGLSICPGTSAGSSAVYTIDPPIPGIMKYVYGSTNNGPVYIKTANSETIKSSQGSTHTTVKISSVGGSFQLMGLTTAVYLAIGLTSGTSSQASGFTLSTST